MTKENTFIKLQFLTKWKKNKLKLKKSITLILFLKKINKLIMFVHNAWNKD